MRRSPLWSNRDFQIFCVAQGLSKFGTQVSTIALPLLAARVTGSATQAALVATVAGLAQLAALLPGGALADRLNRRAIVMVCDAGSLAVMGLLGAAVLFGHAALPLLMAAAAINCALGGVFHSASSGILRRVVSTTELPGAIAVNQARNAAAYLTGPFAGGLLFYASPAAPYLVDAVTFALSFLGFVLIRADLGRVDTGPARRSFVADIGAGIAFLWRNDCLRWTIALSSIINWAFAGIFFTVIVRGAATPGSSVSAGFITGCAGAGSLVGSLVAVRAKELAGPRTVVVTVTAGCALLTTVLVAGVHPLVQALVLFCCAFLTPTMNVVVGSGQMVLTPDGFQGRIQSATSFLAICTQPFGPLAAGVLLAHGSARVAFLAFSAALGVAAVLSAAHRAIRGLPDLRSGAAAATVAGPAVLAQSPR